MKSWFGTYKYTPTSGFIYPFDLELGIFLQLFIHPFYHFYNITIVAGHVA